MQPDVVAVKRDKAEGGLQRRNETHDGQHRVDHGDCLEIEAGAAAGGKDAPDAEQQVDDRVQRVHREQLQLVSEHRRHRDLIVDRAHVMHVGEAGDEAAGADDQEHDAEDHGEGACAHRKSSPCWSFG